MTDAQQPLAKRLADAILHYACEDERSLARNRKTWDSVLAPLLEEVGFLDEVSRLRSTGCECSDEDMCRFARERDEAVAAAVQRWIPVAERMPPPREDVLGFNPEWPGGRAEVGRLHIGWRGSNREPPTHWMPLPEPPEEP